jgi:CRISPR-associated protein Cas2
MDPKAYKMGWLMVAFDLPVKEPDERKRATDFRNFLLDDGYMMMQFSVYVRPCVSFARQETHLRRLRAHVPEEGSIRAIFITKAQWERAFIIHGRPAKEVPAEKMPEQIQLW